MEILRRAVSLVRVDRTLVGGSEGCVPAIRISVYARSFNSEQDGEPSKRAVPSVKSGQRKSQTRDVLAVSRSRSSTCPRDGQKGGLIGRFFGRGGFAP